ncbi:MAG: YHS domain-containing protein [Candidatus Eisenbacteria bacterium]|nr:YHS domain-containing protein [Candidatus Eisenbacteria bacterium]
MASHRDPVCGMTVEESRAAATSEYKGNRYYFCSMECKRQFDRQPEKYATTSATRQGSRSSS